MVALALGTAVAGEAPRRPGPPVPPPARPPVPVAAPRLIGSGRIGTRLDLDPGRWSGHWTLAFQWLRNGAPIAGAEGASYVSSPADDRALLAVRVTASNAAGASSAVTEALAIAWPAPSSTGMLPDLRYFHNSGPQTVNAASNFAGGDLTFSVAGPGVSIDPATGVLRVLTDVLRDGVEVVVTASNSGGAATSRFRLTVLAEPAASLPVPLVAPALAGTGRIGEAVRLDLGTWGGDPAPALAVAWLRDGAEIAGATGLDYLPDDADDRAELRARVTAANAAGVATAETEGLRIARAAPVVVGAILDRTFDQGSGPQAIAAADAFAGEGLVFAVAGAGATVDAATGSVTIPTDAALERAQVTVTATNSGGAAALSFHVAIALAWPANITPELWSASEITDAEEAAAAGYAGQSGHLKAVFDAAIAPAPSGFTLHHDIRGSATPAPIPQLPQVQAGSSLITVGVVAVGDTAYPRLYWRHTASGAFKLAGEQSPVVIRGLDAAAPPVPIVAPALTGTGRIGEAVSLDPGTWTGTPAPELTVAWLRDGVEIGGATGLDYLPDDADDRAELRALITATNAAGAAQAETAGLRITYAAPAVVGALADLVLAAGSGAREVDAAAVFAGKGLVYSVAGGPATVDAATGRVSIPADRTVAGARITVSAANSGGTASVDFELTITAPSIVWPADPSDAHWTVTEVTDPAEATANGFAGESGHLKGVFNASIDPTPSGFVLLHDLRSGPTAAPVPALPPVIAGATVYTTGVVPVGETCQPRLYWHHTASGTMKECGAKAPFVIRGLTAVPPSTGVPGISTAARSQATKVGLVGFNTTYDGCDTPFACYALVALGHSSWRGDQSTDARLLAQLRNGLAGSKCPPGKGGFSMQFDITYAFAALCAKLTSRVWSQLTAAERTKLDLLVKGIGIGGCYTGAANAPTIKSNNQSVNLIGAEMFPWAAPNFSSAPHAALAILRGWLGSDSALMSFLNGFSKSDFHSQVSAQGLANMATVMQSRSAPSPTNAQVNDTIRNLRMVGTSRGGTTYLPTAHLDILESRCQKTWSSSVTHGVNGGAGIVVDGVAWGRIIDGANGLPNRGVSGMCKEFDGSDVGGPRSSPRYAMWASRVTTIHFLALMVSGLLNRGNATVQACRNRAHVGWTDLKYKSDNGYRGYHHGKPGETWAPTATGTYSSTSWIWTTSFSVWFDALKPWLDG